jgi:hypothetical protein
MEVGNGLATGQGSNPQIGLEVSRDNGKTWGAQMWKAIGAIGAYASASSGAGSARLSISFSG